MNSTLAQGLWVRLSDDVAKAIRRMVGYWQVLGINDNGRLRVASFDPGEPGEREVRKLRGVPADIGDGVITIRIPGLFEVAIGSVLLDGQTDVGSGWVPEHDHPPHSVHESASATAATVSSTTDTANLQEALATTIDLPEGTWTVKVRAQGNFSHSASGSMRRAIEIDGGLYANGTATLTTARETYPIATQRLHVEGGRTITVRLLYHSNSAGTTGCRAPSLDIVAERE